MRALQAQSNFEQSKELLNLKNRCRFWKHHNHTIRILLDCSDEFFVSDEDKESLQDLGPLERSHMSYLLDVDPEALKLFKTKRQKTSVFTVTIEYSFGLINRNIKQVQQLHE